MSTIFHKSMVGGVILVSSLIYLTAGAEIGHNPYDFGTTPTDKEIAAVDIDVMPDGHGLPAGQGTYARGKKVYQANCAACHGKDLQGVKGTGGVALTGGRGTLTGSSPKKTVESYWPYATTVFDYVRRAMPFNAPGSLSNDDVYAVTDYLLAKGHIIGKNETLDANTLPKVKMPNRNGFIPDSRPDVHNYQ